MSEQGTTLKWLNEAINLEENGKKGYKSAQQEVADPLAQELFGRLAELEDDHIIRIKEIFGQVSEHKAWPKDAKPSTAGGLNHENLKAWFREPMSKYQGRIKNAKAAEAAQIGADFEASAVKFYQNYRDQATDPGERFFLDAIMKEEETHLALLNELKLYYSDPETWALLIARGGLDGA